jgi:NADPH2:quinone reductase
MKAIQHSEFGGIEVLKYLDVQEAKPGPHEALVELAAIGVNFADTYTRTGVRPVPLPAIPGVEGAGVVLEVGEGVTEVVVGDLVAYSNVMNSYAERIIAPSWRLIKLPKGMDAVTGATAILQGMTAHYLCNSTYPLKKGDTALIHAGAGGMGLLLIQTAKSLGATVITTVSNSTKEQLAKEAGADHTIIYTEQDFETEVMEITEGKGVETVYESVGKDTFDKSLASLAPRGYLVLYGQASGPVPPISPTILAPKSIFLTRPGLESYTNSREELVERATNVLTRVHSGELKLRTHGIFPLQEAAEAHRQLEARVTTGKLLLTP